MAFVYFRICHFVYYANCLACSSCSYSTLVHISVSVPQIGEISKHERISLFMLSAWFILNENLHRACNILFSRNMIFIENYLALKSLCENIFTTIFGIFRVYGSKIMNVSVVLNKYHLANSFLYSEWYKISITCSYQQAKDFWYWKREEILSVTLKGWDKSRILLLTIFSERRKIFLWG